MFLPITATISASGHFPFASDTFPKFHTNVFWFQHAASRLAISAKNNRAWAV
jgi:hypothetical protein